MILKNLPMYITLIVTIILHVTHLLLVEQLVVPSNSPILTTPTRIMMKLRHNFNQNI